MSSRLRWMFLFWLAMSAVLTRLTATEPAKDPNAPADAILTRWLQVIGGAERWEKLQTVDYQCRVRQREAERVMRVRATATGRYRYDSTLGTFGELVQAYDGSLSWQNNATLGFGLIASPDHAVNVRGTNFRAPVQVKTHYSWRRVLSDETIDGRRLQVIELRTATSAPEKWYFDPVTGDRVRTDQPGASGRLVVDFSDFRTAEGAAVRDPFRIVRREGNWRAEMVMERIAYDQPMAPELFSAPPDLIEGNKRVDRILFRNALASGQSVISGLQTRVMEQSIKVLSSGVEVSSTMYQKQPNRSLTEQDSPGTGKSWRGFNGRIGWVWTELEGYRELKGAELEQMIANADLRGPLTLGAKSPLRRWLGEREESGRRLLGVGLATLKGPAGELFIDAETALLARVETQVQAGENGHLKIKAEFSDYREVDGVMIPFVTQLINPALQVVITVKSVKHNEPLDDAMFEPRKQ